MNDTTKAAPALDSCVYCGGGVPVGGGLTAGVARDADGRKGWLKSCSLPCHKKHLAKAIGGRRCVTCGKKFKYGKTWLCSKACRREALVTAKQAASRKREQEAIDRRNEEHRKAVEAQRQADREWRDQLLKGAGDGD